tara:strand:+ start:1313 stop:1903 length:591 start_codon:yes stop_codon:yes gene_type:complete
MRRSSNCKAYTDTVSLLVDGTATVPGDADRCTFALPATFSCQTKAFEKPDAATAAGLTALATEALEARGCDASKMELTYATNLVGAQQLEYSGKKLSELGMASNCHAFGNDLNDATHKVTAKCRSMYDMTDAQGNRVRDYHKTFLSNLVACDISDDAMPQLMEDARKVAAYNGAVNGFTVDKPEDLACEFAVLPVL